MNNYLQDILTYFRNLTLNSLGVSRDLYKLLEDRDVDRALQLLQNRDDEVELALSEFNPQTHKVMRRPNKYRRNDLPYITEKLPRTRQRYINEVELFFLLGRPIVWKKLSGSDVAYGRFTSLLDSQYFDSRMRHAKRLAGAETESALLFHLYRDEKSGERKSRLCVLARSTGYRLRPLFDQYGNMTAFCYGYVTKEGGRNVRHWDFQTPELLVYCRRGAVGWEVRSYPNPTGRINAVYFRQPKAWDGVEARLEREEMLDSKTGDANNYFSDPIAAATADVVESMVDPDRPGKLIQLGGDRSRFEYINPPQSSQTREAEKADLAQSILFDTFTPDFDVQNMRGFGSLSGTAIRNAMILGYIKRDNRREIYDELVGRFRNVALGVAAHLHPEEAGEIGKLEVGFEFAEPFDDDKRANRASIAQLYQAGLVSAQTAVSELGLTDSPQEELARLKEAAAGAGGQA